MCRVDLSQVITWITFNALLVCGSGREGLKLACSISFCPVICVCLVKENPDIKKKKKKQYFRLWAHKNTPKLKVYVIVFLKPLLQKLFTSNKNALMTMEETQGLIVDIL